MARFPVRLAALGLVLACAACQGAVPGGEPAALTVRLSVGTRALQAVDALSGLERVALSLDRIEHPGEPDEQVIPVLEGGRPLARNLEASGLAAGATFAPLAPGATYRVSAVGYGAGDVAVTGIAEARAVARAGASTPVALVLTRTDRAFAGGLALPGVTVSPGGFASPSPSPEASREPLASAWHFTTPNRFVRGTEIPPLPDLLRPADTAAGERLALRRDADSVRCQRQRADGAALEAERTLGTGATQGPWGVFDPGQGAYVVLWSAGDTLVGCRVGRDGQTLGEPVALATAFPASATTGLALNAREGELALMSAVNVASTSYKVIAARFPADLGASATLSQTPLDGPGRINCEAWCGGMDYTIVITRSKAFLSFDPGARRYRLYHLEPGMRACQCLAEEYGSDPEGKTMEYERVEFVP